MQLVCKGLSKVFGANRALNNIDFQVESGEIRALLGGNGSGKSTLSKIIGGALGMTEGRMEFNQQPYHPRSPIDAKRLGIVFTSQELSLLENLTVEENLMLCSFSIEHQKRIHRKQIQNKSRQLLRRYHLEYLADKTISQLAANEQYLIEFMKAMMQDPKILIIDEITSALYKEDVKIISQVMKEQKEKGNIVIFISHRMPEIMELCDTVTVLRNGSMAGCFATKEVSEMRLVSEMTGRPDADQEPISHTPTERMPVKAEGPPLFSVQHMKLPAFMTEIDLQIHKGEIIGVAGLQGHGQSDLLRQLFGLLPNDGAELMLEGRTIAVSSPTQAIWHGISFVSGERGKEGIFEEQTIAENTQAVAELILHHKVDEEEILKDYRVKYQSKRDLITSLSGGNQQKVVIARWLAANPKLLLADDPTKGIDVQARRDVHKIMCQMTEKGSSVLMVSSDDEELVNITRMAANSRIIVMYEGQIVKTLTKDEISIEQIAAASVNLNAVQEHKK